MNLISDQLGIRYTTVMFFYVYILYSKKDGMFYTGVTSDLRNRYHDHQSGKSRATRFRRPFKLVYYEAYLLKSDAEAREKYLKTSMGKRVIKKQLANFLKSERASLVNITLSNEDVI